MSAEDFYYLTANEMQHYRYMLEHDYPQKLVKDDGQQYLVFQVLERPRVGIAWPTVTGELDGLSNEADTIFQYYKPLQQKLMPHIEGSTIAVLIFPQYAR
jgi:hypothetical protein